MQSAFFPFSDTVQRPMDMSLASLELNYGKITVYSAGLPNFPANFTRDGILSAILLKDAKMLRNQLVFCSIFQGTKRSAYTGEELGKIFHEMPGARIDGLSTEYNACDATSLFLYGHEIYVQLTDDYEFVVRQRKYLERAVSYILRHIVNNLFVEDPKYCGSSRFALQVTYWKDSHISNRANGSPMYPAVYTLAHVQAMRALKSAAILLNSPDLLRKAYAMLKHVFVLFDQKRGMFSLGLDQQGFFPGVSSDNLHLLYYLKPDEISPEKVASIVEGMKILESQCGYMTMNTKDPWLQHDVTKHSGYHTNTVWPFEQAFIHSAAKKFHLPHVAEIASRVTHHLDTYPELFVLREGVLQKSGSTTQLWTIAAKHYFDTFA
jgi:glycogen debranching enzyme